MSTLDQRFLDLSREISDGLSRLPIPGLAVGVLHEGKEYTAGFGITSAENPLPVTPDTLFQVGSISKTFTATALMILREAGELDLDTPVRTYLPDFQLRDQSVAARVTLRHLLTHTGGWLGDYFNDFGYGDDAQAMMLREIAQLPQLTPLGEVWSYCNTGFNIAGRIIEVLTGQAYEDVIRRTILDPLGMNMTFYFPYDAMTYRFAVGHEVKNREAKVARPWPIGRAGHPVGGVISTVVDLLKYARFHLGDGRGVLKPGSIKLMQTPIVQGSGLDVFGLSWFITPIGDLQVLRHGGATHGFTAEFTIVPARQFAIATLTNSDEGSLLNAALRTSAIKQYLNVAWPDPPHITLTPRQLAGYVGRYDAPEDERDLEIKDGILWMATRPKGGFPTPDSPPGEAPAPTRLAFYAEDKFVARDEPLKGSRGEFLRDAAGAIAWLRFSSRVHRPL